MGAAFSTRKSLGINLVTMKTKSKYTRSGAATVEFAVILPLVITLLLGSVEMGRAVMVQHVLEEASRAGCRVAVFENSSTGDVEDIVSAAMNAAGIENYTVTVSPNPPENLDAFEPVSVKIEVSYSQVAFFASSFMKNRQLIGVCVMPAEGDGANDPGGTDPPSGKKNTKKTKKDTKKSKKDTKKSKKSDDDDDDDDDNKKKKKKKKKKKNDDDDDD